MKRSNLLASTCLSLLAAVALAIASPQPAFADANADLVTAAAHGDTAKVVQLLTHGADVNVRDSGGYTPLIWAALNGHDAVVGELLRRGADVRARDKESYTALMWASQNHRADALRALLAHGANPNEVDREGYTALTWAAQDGQAGIAVDLLLNHADPNARDRAGYTALMWAAQQGHNSVVKALIMNGANPNVRDLKGFSALDLAIAFNRYDVKEYLTHVAPRSAAVSQGAHASYYGAPAPHGRYHSRGGVVAVVGTPDMQWSNGSAGANYVQNGYYVNGVWMGSNMQANPYTQGNPYPESYAYPQGNPYMAANPGMMNNGAPAWTTAQNNSVDARIATFDVDNNRIIDGRDWRALSPDRRTELANIVHGVRCNKAYCTPGHPASVRSKLDWVYADPARLGLTINMAYDFPTPNSGKASW